MLKTICLAAITAALVVLGLPAKGHAYGAAPFVRSCFGRAADDQTRQVRLLRRPSIAEFVRDRGIVTPETGVATRVSHSGDPAPASSEWWRLVACGCGWFGLSGCCEWFGVADVL